MYTDFRTSRKRRNFRGFRTSSWFLLVKKAFPLSVLGVIGRGCLITVFAAAALLFLFF